MFILWWLQVRCQVYSLLLDLRHSSILAHVQGELCIDYSRWLLYRRYNDVANIITCICFHLRRFSEFRRIGTVSGSSQDCSAPVVRLLLVFSLAVLARAIQLGGHPFFFSFSWEAGFTTRSFSSFRSRPVYTKLCRSRLTPYILQ